MNKFEKAFASTFAIALAVTTFSGSTPNKPKSSIQQCLEDGTFVISKEWEESFNGPQKTRILVDESGNAVLQMQMSIDGKNITQEFPVDAKDFRKLNTNGLVKGKSFLSPELTKYTIDCVTNIPVHWNKNSEKITKISNALFSDKNKKTLFYNLMPDGIINNIYLNINSDELGGKINSNISFRSESDTTDIKFTPELFIVTKYTQNRTITSAFNYKEDATPATALGYTLGSITEGNKLGVNLTVQIPQDEA